MYFKVVINTDEKIVNTKSGIVRYMEADSVNKLFAILNKYYGLSPDNPGTTLKMFRTVDRDEFDAARLAYQGMLN